MKEIDSDVIDVLLKSLKKVDEWSVNKNGGIKHKNGLNIRLIHYNLFYLKETINYVIFEKEGVDSFFKTINLTESQYDEIFSLVSNICSIEDKKERTSEIIFSLDPSWRKT